MVGAQSVRRVVSLLCLGTICLMDACGGSSKSATTNSSGATLVSLDVAPVAPTIPVGASQ